VSGPPVLVAPDSFKGTFPATAVAQAIGRGLARAGATADLCPVADGGEGTIDALADALGAERWTAAAHDPLGRPVEAVFALGTLGGRRTAIVETAAASGLGRVAPEERDAWAASTSGTGELIAAAARAGARTILVGVGGSATTDGGTGALEAIAAAGGLGDARVVVLCDVRTPFEDAARVFAPQKGAGADTVVALGERLDAVARRLPRDPRGVAMTGAAGGLSGALWAAHGARLVPGAGFVLDAIAFDARARAASAIVTGEGRLDEQTLAGKVISEVARRTGGGGGGGGVPLYALVGRDDLPRERRAALGLAEVLETPTLDALTAAGEWIGRRHRVAASP